MNKRTKSSINLRITERLADREVELDDLKDKIQKSKPILETIYDKVQRRQSIYQQKLFDNKKAINEGRDLAKEYKKLYEENLQFMKKSMLFDSFDGSPSNYLKTRKNRFNKEPEKSKSVYEQYKQRIERGRKGEKVEQKNPEITNLRIENKELHGQMEKQIEQLRMLRKKSQKSLKKASSVGYLRANLSAVPQTEGSKKEKERDLKQKIMTRKSQKLKRG